MNPLFAARARARGRSGRSTTTTTTTTGSSNSGKPDPGSNASTSGVNATAAPWRVSMKTKAAFKSNNTPPKSSFVVPALAAATIDEGTIATTAGNTLTTSDDHDSIVSEEADMRDNHRTNKMKHKTDDDISSSLLYIYPFLIHQQPSSSKCILDFEKAQPRASSSLFDMHCAQAAQRHQEKYERDQIIRSRDRLLSRWMKESQDEEPQDKVRRGTKINSVQAISSSVFLDLRKSSRLLWHQSVALSSSLAPGMTHHRIQDQIVFPSLEEEEELVDFLHLMRYEHSFLKEVSSNVEPPDKAPDAKTLFVEPDHDRLEDLRWELFSQIAQVTLVQNNHNTTSSSSRSTAFTSRLLELDQELKTNQVVLQAKLGQACLVQYRAFLEQTCGWIPIKEEKTTDSTWFRKIIHRRESSSLCYLLQVQWSAVENSIQVSQFQLSPAMMTKPHRANTLPASSSSVECTTTTIHGEQQQSNIKPDVMAWVFDFIIEYYFQYLLLVMRKDIWASLSHKSMNHQTSALNSHRSSSSSSDSKTHHPGFILGVEFNWLWLQSRASLSSSSSSPSSSSSSLSFITATHVMQSNYNQSNYSRSPDIDLEDHDDQSFSARILLRYIGVYAERYGVHDGLHHGSLDTIFAVSYDGRSFHSYTESNLTKPRYIFICLPARTHTSHHLTPGRKTTTTTDDDDDDESNTVQFFVLSSKSSSSSSSSSSEDDSMMMGNSGSSEQVMDHVVQYMTTLLHTAAMDFRKDVCWARILHEERPNVMNMLMMLGEGLENDDDDNDDDDDDILMTHSTTVTQLEECLALSIRTSLESIDPSLYRILFNSSMMMDHHWEEFLCCLDIVYEHEIRAYQFEQVYHVLLLCPDAEDLIIHIGLILPEHHEAIEEEEEDLMEKDFVPPSCFIEICRREEPPDQSFSTDQRKAISNFVNCICHWIWKTCGTEPITSRIMSPPSSPRSPSCHPNSSFISI